MTEAELTAMKEGQQDAWREAFREFTPGLRKYCYHLVRWSPDPQEEADELTQRTWAKASAGIQKFVGPPERFHAWLKRIATNTHRDNGRMQQSQPRVTAGIETVESTPDLSKRDASGDLEVGERIEFLECAIAALEPSYQMIVKLRKIDELSTREASSLLGESVSTLDTRLSRARWQLDALWQMFVNGEPEDAVIRDFTRPDTSAVSLRQLFERFWKKWKKR